ncbi:hypothetical protein K7X08_035797 [Anisodus acutangulus]|uniref:Uncharacterized protein n=1 Tax=Anisodus acutangulus TaxID=402998 RepID=A0A9Q1L4T7_9SOLA|nr:hypothetical protein K7X08_035797 [Anisodus acutangulus]
MLRIKVMSTSVTFKLVSRDFYGLLSIYVLFDSVNFDLVNALDGSPLSDPSHVTNVDGSFSRFPDQIDDPSCMTLPLNDPAHVLIGNVVGEEVDSVMANEDQSPDGRIIDVLAQLNGKDDIEEIRDVAQNENETANEEVV